MLKAIEDVLNDESFHIPLEPAAMAFKQATGMFQWIVLIHQRMAGTLLAVEKEEPATVKSSAKGHPLDPVELPFCMFCVL